MPWDEESAISIKTIATHLSVVTDVSIAVIDDESDYDAFKNFGIDAWIKRDDINQLNGIINLVNKRLLS